MSLQAYLGSLNIASSCTILRIESSNVMSEMSMVFVQYICMKVSSLGPERLHNWGNVLESLQLEGLRLGLAIPSHAPLSSLRMPSGRLGCGLLVCAAVCRPCCGRVLPGMLPLTPVPHVIALNQALDRWAVSPACKQNILVL